MSAAIKDSIAGEQQDIAYSPFPSISRSPAASVGIVSGSDSWKRTLESVLRDESTQLITFASPADLATSLGIVAVDVAVIDDLTLGQPARNLLALRRRAPSIFVVCVNVRDETRCAVLLDAGADDVVVASSPLLPSRLLAAARRARTLNAAARISVGDIVFDREARKAWSASCRVFLTPTEFAVLDCLFWHAPRPVNVAAIAAYVWGRQLSHNPRNLVQASVSRLRRKLAGSQHTRLSFVRGKGYALESAALPTIPIYRDR